MRPQSPVAFLELDSEPEPDIVWATRRDYGDSHPAGADVLLLIEVADSSLDYDRTEKVELYAKAGVQDYWIANLIERVIEVRRAARDGAYQEAKSYGAGESVRPLAAPQVELSVDWLFGAAK